VGGYSADFGPLVLETDVDLAVAATLKRWLPTYLAQLRVERPGIPRLEPQSFANTLDDEEFLDHHLPAIIVTTAQTEGDPEVDGNGMYRTAYRVVVSVVVSARTPGETRAAAALFGGSCRRSLVHHPSLGGFASGTRWRGGNVAPVADPANASRNLAAAINQFTVYVDDVLGGDGPIDPDIPTPYEPADPDTPERPYDPLATVREGGVTVDVRAVPITEDPGA
jgi:hypothetical protein